MFIYQPSTQFQWLNTQSFVSQTKANTAMDMKAETPSALWFPKGLEKENVEGTSLYQQM